MKKLCFALLCLATSADAYAQSNAPIAYEPEISFTANLQEVCGGEADQNSCFQDVTLAFNEYRSIIIDTQLDSNVAICRPANSESSSVLFNCTRFVYTQCNAPVCFGRRVFKSVFQNAPGDGGSYPSTEDFVRFAGFEDNYCSARDDDINKKRFNFPRYVVVENGVIKIFPRSKSVPSFAIPNTVGAEGWSWVNASEHVYNVYTDISAFNLTPQVVSDRLKSNPTPGDDQPASANGTLNDVGEIFRQDFNFVKSFYLSSPNPSLYTDIVINYTVENRHEAHEGYVIKFGVIGADGFVKGLRSYGEGEAWIQDPALSFVWCPAVVDVWEENHDEITTN